MVPIELDALGNWIAVIRDERAALRAIERGETLATALRAAGRAAPARDWFASWASAGMFAAVPGSRSGTGAAKRPSRGLGSSGDRD